MLLQKLSCVSSWKLPEAAIPCAEEARLLTRYVREQYVGPTEAQQSAIEVRLLAVMVLKKEKDSAVNLNDIIGFTK